MNVMQEISELGEMRGNIIQICIGLYQIILNVSDDISISIESNFSVIDAVGTKEVVNPPYHRSSAILMLLDKNLLGASFVESGNLVLTFSDGFKIEIEKGDQEYESFQISKGDNFVVR